MVTGHFQFFCSEPDVFQGPLPQTTRPLTRKERYISDKQAFLKDLFFLQQNSVLSSVFLPGGSIFLEGFFFFL